jgi:hypothetical protein
MASDDAERDTGAGLRLTAASLKLRAFTARALAEAAEVKQETARNFITRRRAEDIIVAIDEPLVDGDKIGRPENVYQLSPDRRRAVEGELGRIRSRLDDITKTLATAASEPADTPCLRGLLMLEWAISGLEENGVNCDDAASRLAQINVFRGAAELDLHAFARRTTKQSQVVILAERLGAAKARHDIILSSIDKYSNSVFATSIIESIDNLLHDYKGSWLPAPNENFNKFTGGAFLFLDACSAGPDNPFRRGLADFVEETGMAIAALPVGSFRRRDWRRMYATLNFVNPAGAGAATVLTDIYLGVDEGSSATVDLIDEISALHDTSFAPEGFRPGRPPRVWCLDTGIRDNLMCACESFSVKYVGQAPQNLRQTLINALQMKPLSPKASG